MNFVEIGGRNVATAIFVNMTFLEKSEYYPLYVGFVAVEASILITLFILYPGYVKTLTDSRHFHLNLRRLYMAFGATCFMTVIGRAILVAFQFGLFEFPGPPINRYFVIFATYLRGITIVWNAFLIAGVLMERLAATLWVEDYEQIKFSEVSSIIIFLHTASALVLITIVLEFVYNWYFFVVFFVMGGSGILIIGSLVLFKFLYSWNLRQLQEMREYGMKNVTGGLTNQYLSRRFQVEENVNALELVKSLTIGYAIATSILGGCLGVPFILETPNTNFCQLMLALFDVGVALSGIMYYFILLYRVKPWWNGFKANLRKIFGSNWVPELTRSSQIEPGHMNYVEIGNRHVVVALLTNKTFLEESIYYPFYVMLTIFEGIVMGCILFLCPIYVKTLAGSRHFHLNLTRLYIAFGASCPITIFGRFIIIGYQFGSFEFPGTADDRYVLIFATYLRLFSPMWDVFFLVGVLVERLAATLKIGFYETVNLTRVSTCIIVWHFVMIFLVLTLITECMYDYYWAVACSIIGGILLLVVTSLTLFKILYSWNLRQLRQMREFGMKNIDAATDRYLSRRFQLEENVNALELLKTITIYCAFATVACLSFIGVQLILDDPNTNLSQFMLILFDLSTAVAPFFYFILLLYKVEPWRLGITDNLRKLFGPGLVPDFGRKTRIDPRDSIDESAHYFSYYHNAWN